MTVLRRPDHPWNDPDGDGHNCVDCAPDSIWKCDEAMHPLSSLTGLNINDPYDLLTADERKKLFSDLERLARARRRAAGRAHEIWLT